MCYNLKDNLIDSKREVEIKTFGGLDRENDHMKLGFEARIS